MNILLDKLPTTVKLLNIETPLNYSFKAGIRFEQIMKDESLADDEKLNSTLELYYKDAFIIDIKEALDKIMWFYNLGKDIEEKQEEKETTGAESNTAEREYIYDYEVDANLIYSAFLEQYNIDLTQEDLHWWKFRALLEGLNENTRFAKVMSIRSTQITNDMSDAERSYYRRMKDLYKIDNKTQQDKEKQFYDALGALF